MGLRPPFLAQFEVLDGQVGDELALLIGHADDDFHQVRFGAKDRGLLRHVGRRRDANCEDEGGSDTEPGARRRCVLN